MRHAPLLPPYVYRLYLVLLLLLLLLCLCSIFLILYCITGGFDSGSSNGTPSYTDEFCRFSEQQQQHSLLVAESLKKKEQKRLSCIAHLYVRKWFQCTHIAASLAVITEDTSIFIDTYIRGCIYLILLLYIHTYSISKKCCFPFIFVKLFACFYYDEDDDHHHSLLLAMAIWVFK